MLCLQDENQEVAETREKDKEYPINSAENNSLMYTWKYIYNSKFTNETLSRVPYAYTLKFQFSVFSLIGLQQSLIAKEVLKILESELKI